MGDTQSFYDILQIPNDASPEQIRRAYKKQALMTHPDRLPAGYTPTDKINAEERFRKVSNAYEVLKDPENRRLYDAHGVWPPPTPPEQPYSSRREYHRSGRPNCYEPFPDPFASFFSEPFELFDKIFSEYRRPSYHSMHRSSSNWHRGPFEAMYRMQDMMSDLDRELFSFPTRPLSGFDPLPFGNSGQTQWASQSTIVSSVNGVTRRIDKRRDWEGNEHVTHTYPDGREVYKINGVEQQRSTHGYLPPPGTPPPPYSSRNALPQMNNARRAFSICPTPSYHSPRSSGHNSNGCGSSSLCSSASHGYRRDRHSSGPIIPGDAGPVIPDVNAEKRRWWRGGH